MEADGDNIVWFTYTGQEDIPRDATHIFVSVRVILRLTFRGHPNIVEVICDEDVEKIEERAFARCPRLRRVIMPGVKIVEQDAFFGCEALADVECGKLEIIKRSAFYNCRSLRTINLPYARIVEGDAFGGCGSLMDAKFGNKLERFGMGAFYFCTSLERITIPLKDGMITHDNTFIGCAMLYHVDLVEGALLNETISALHLEGWRNDMNKEIDFIDRALPTSVSVRVPVPTAGAGDGGRNAGEKARVIRTWIGSVLRQLGHYKAEHRRLLEEDVVPTLQRFLPQDIVMNNAIPFLNLPSNVCE
eukprot:CAMPEP_0201710204 /NCGR_PEP_ID=MMETSP0578-20130828/58508_1 /ASSEMBLY_ACC=CAM_ASM_000663 /TAXON_ID=267565 /ORGANISM="Skeletonema grethea, Strain CCMP 1804" /LENGTH=302 /DNA_ID=CAMNT_0048199225 /DNA_START=98 /DNA_END=1006 /DNA_ORIENTATION=-